MKIRMQANVKSRNNKWRCWEKEVPDVENNRTMRYQNLKIASKVKLNWLIEATSRDTPRLRFMHKCALIK
jgi:hypothetical protein